MPLQCMHSFACRLKWIYMPSCPHYIGEFNQHKVFIWNEHVQNLSCHYILKSVLDLISLLIYLFIYSFVTRSCCVVRAGLELTVWITQDLNVQNSAFQVLGLQVCASASCLVWCWGTRPCVHQASPLPAVLCPQPSALGFYQQVAFVFSKGKYLTQLFWFTFQVKHFICLFLWITLS